MHGCSMHNNARRPEGNYGEESSGGNEKEVMGPYEWLDNEIKRLSSILQRRQAMDPRGNHGLDINGVLDSVDGVLKDAENDGVRSSSSAITDHRGDEWQICNWSSLVGNSGFDSNGGELQWCDIDDQWELPWDDSDKVLSWLWDEEIGKTRN
ncbi:hypothetical protein V6N13_022915 [Hibiscus sabdariffa]|uniref:Uncharacterized protein n=2 Tax=Hibiscus sabdariffa TaxID=183260 RepID=A0ABR2P0K7_9ROSI